MSRMTNEREIALACFKATGTVGRWELFETSNAPHDAQSSDFKAELSWQGGRCLYTCEIKPYLTRDGLTGLLDRARRLQRRGEIPLILSRHVTPQIGDNLHGLDIQFADTAGNAFLRGEGLQVWITGKTAPKPRGAATGPYTSSGLKLIYVLLKNADAARWTQRELASCAGIALGSVGRILKDLHQRGYLARAGSSELKLTKQQGLLALWDTGYSEILRPKLLRGTYSPGPDRDLEAWLETYGAIASRHGVHVGGEVGTAILTQAIRPTSLTLHVFDQDVDAMKQDLSLYPDSPGNVSMVMQFGEIGGGRVTDSGLTLADPLLMRAELLLHPHERLQSARDMLLEKYILPRFDHDS